MPCLSFHCKANSSNCFAQKQTISVDTLYIQTLVDSCKTLKDGGDYTASISIGKNILDVIELSFANADILTKNFLKKSKATTFRNMGNSYKELSDFPNAIDSYKKCLKIAEAIGDKMNIGGAVLNTGVVNSAGVA